MVNRRRLKQKEALNPSEEADRKSCSVNVVSEVEFLWCWLGRGASRLFLLQEKDLTHPCIHWPGNYQLLCTRWSLKFGKPSDEPRHSPPGLFLQTHPAVSSWRHGQMSSFWDKTIKPHQSPLEPRAEFQSQRKTTTRDRKPVQTLGAD